MCPQPLKTGVVFRKKLYILKAVSTTSCCRQFVNTGITPGCIVIRLVLPVLLMISLISCQVPQQNLTSSSENSDLSKILLIPRWYAELPNVNGCRLAYGYGGLYLDNTRQKEAIIKNGAANMAKNDKVLIKAGWVGTQSRSQGLTASYILEKEWQDRASLLEKNLKIVREYRMKNGVIALCAFCPDEALFQNLINQIDDSPVNINADKPPEWVREPKSHPDYIYGIGTAPSRIKPGKAWEEAERQARAALALNLAGRHNILLKTISENTSSMSQKLSETDAEIALTNVTIIRHGYSYANKSFYALAQMPTPAHRVNTDN